MSASVWYDEVDAGLLKELQQTVRIKNSGGFLVPMRDEAFVVRKPEEEFSFETFPCVSIYNLSSKYDPTRHNPETVVVSRDITNKVAIVEDSAIPFNLSYQIDFWAKYQSDMNSMIKTWLRNHFRQFNLTVIDDGGAKSSCNCIMKGDVKKSDLVLGGERLFHSIINLLIWVELNDEIRYNVPMVIKVNPDFRTI